MMPVEEVGPGDDAQFPCVKEAGKSKRTWKPTSINAGEWECIGCFVWGWLDVQIGPIYNVAGLTPAEAPRDLLPAVL